MENTIISEGKSIEEAVKNGLEILKVGKEDVDITLIEDKKTFFDILAPKKVQIKLTLKEKKDVKDVDNSELSLEEKNEIVNRLESFMSNFVKSLPENTTFTVGYKKENIEVRIKHGELGFLIGNEGTTLYSMQEILLAIANKGARNRVIVDLDIEDYKAKRIERIKVVVEDTVKKVIETKRSIKLDPMRAYERKVVHNLVQENNNVRTKSDGEEPYRRIEISYKNN